MDDVCLDAPRPQPVRQPQAVVAGLESHSDARDVGAAPLGLFAPAPYQGEQCVRVRRKLLQRLALDPGNQAADESARLAHFDHRHQRAVHIQDGEGPAQVIRLMLCRLAHRGLHLLVSPRQRWMQGPRRPPHSIYPPQQRPEWCAAAKRRSVPIAAVSDCNKVREQIAYSITSSARARIVGGMVRSSALAAFRLMTSSSFVGC